MFHYGEFMFFYDLQIWGGTYYSGTFYHGSVEPRDVMSQHHIVLYSNYANVCDLSWQQGAKHLYRVRNGKKGLLQYCHYDLNFSYLGLKSFKIWWWATSNSNAYNYQQGFSRLLWKENYTPTVILVSVVNKKYERKNIVPAYLVHTSHFAATPRVFYLQKTLGSGHGYVYCIRYHRRL